MPLSLRLCRIFFDLLMLEVFNKLRKVNGLGSIDEIQTNIRNIIK